MREDLLINWARCCQSCHRVSSLSHRHWCGKKSCIRFRVNLITKKHFQVQQKQHRGPQNHTWLSRKWKRKTNVKLNVETKKSPASSWYHCSLRNKKKAAGNSVTRHTETKRVYVCDPFETKHELDVRPPLIHQYLIRVYTAESSWCPYPWRIVCLYSSWARAVTGKLWSTVSATPSTSWSTFFMLDVVWLGFGIWPWMIAEKGSTIHQQ